jgi:hypothetical protein
MKKNQMLINTDLEVNLPIIGKADDISFASLQYVEEVLGALLKAKQFNGPAWNAAKKLLDVSYTADGYVQFTLKVHGLPGKPIKSADADYDEFHSREAELKARRHNRKSTIPKIKLDSNNNSATGSSRPDIVKFAFKG